MAEMLPDGRRLGAHLALATGMVKAAERAAAIGAEALQIFSDNPTAWERRAEPSAEITPFRAVLDRHGIAPLAIHGSYLVNLAGADPSFHDGSVALLAAELDAAGRFGARFVNIHIGSHRGAGVEVGIERLVEGIRRALGTETGDGRAAGAVDGPPTAGTATAETAAGASTPAATHATVITLENSAGGGWGLGVDVGQLAQIAAALDQARVPRERVGFCLDTAHLWGAGADLREAAVVERLVSSFADEIGLDRLPLIHLNDTKAELGSRNDRHEHLGAGRIGPEGIASILREPRLRHATYIIETPGMEEGYDAINLARAVALARGEPLAPLPPGALTLRGSRAKAATPPTGRPKPGSPPEGRPNPGRRRVAPGRTIASSTRDRD
jgi:deoxyribonuclease IV